MEDPKSSAVLLLLILIVRFVIVVVYCSMDGLLYIIIMIHYIVNMMITYIYVNSYRYVIYVL